MAASDAATRVLSGWGLTGPTAARVVEPASTGEVTAALRAAAQEPRGVVARGLGRAYGDAAQNAGGTVLDCTGLDGIEHIDLERGVVVCEGGTSLDTLMRVLVPAGWFVPVTPGTRFVTVGGAVAADIHGKNHHAEGNFTRHLDWIDLALASGEVRRVLPGEPAFEATAGGMGLTGVVVRASIRLLPVETSWMRVDTERAVDLDDCLERMTATDHLYRYSVAWIDTMAKGRSLGRSVLTRGDHARRSDLPRERAAGGGARRYGPGLAVPTPPWVPTGLLRKQTVLAFNELWFRKAPVHHEGGIESIPAFFHPLDMVVRWNRIYGRHGFVQHQFVVPFDRADTLRAALERLSAARCPSFLAVLKAFGDIPGGTLSFPRPGWTLALDIPAALPGLGPLLDQLDELVLDAGGRVYLAKDSRMQPEVFEAMYPELPGWRSVRDALDPHRVLTSDLDRRLGLTSPRAGRPPIRQEH